MTIWCHLLLASKRDTSFCSARTDPTFVDLGIVQTMAQLIESKTFTLLSAVFVLPLLVLACRDFDDRSGSSGLTPTNEAVAAGLWVGNYNTQIGVGDAGEVTFVIEQEPDGILSGCSCWTNAACWADGEFRGAVKEDKVVSATLLNVLRDPVGTRPRRSATRIPGEIDITGNLMTANFEVATDDARRCTDSIARTGDQGLVSLRRVELDVDVLGTCAAITAQVEGVGDCSEFIRSLD
jgi:hypothetical protein